MSGGVLFEALNQYGLAEEDTIKRLRTEARRIRPDVTDEELAHFIHAKAHLIRGREGLGFLLTGVPRCLAGEQFEHFRKTQREAREHEAVERAQHEAELARWRREQQDILDD